VALGIDGQYYNVNADQMASACAVACQADALIFLTDVPGVKDADGLVIRWLNLNLAAELAQKSVIQGGMLPKLDACKNALLHGVNRVRILPAAEVEVLPDFYFAKIESGTEVLVA
jgi:acetylglutamate kinase